jgi:23S rRNA pseudouridine955/2504/2580 synthase/23S rRNA pseudouridine1911/1915/1917 synthase
MTEEINGGRSNPVHPVKPLNRSWIVFENEQFVAINKPAGVLSIPDRVQSEPSLKDMLLETYGNIYTIHRLDKETSGIILFAKDEATHKYYSKQFEERTVEKFYLGLVQGTLPYNSGTIDAPIMEHPVFKGQMVVNQKGKSSVTDYELVESYGKYSLVKFQIHSGRTHQVRVHAKNIGCPIVCDPLYGDGKPIMLSSIKKKYKLSKHDEEERPMLNRVALHSFQLKFIDANGEQHSLEAELPKDMRALVQQLKKNR